MRTSVPPLCKPCRPLNQLVTRSRLKMKPNNMRPSTALNMGARVSAAQVIVSICMFACCLAETSLFKPKKIYKYYKV